jgi:hypothetical protein
VDAIKDLYRGFRGIVYNVGYSARKVRVGKEVMFFAPSLNIPGLVGPIHQIGNIGVAA